MINAHLERHVDWYRVSGRESDLEFAAVISEPAKAFDVHPHQREPFVLHDWCKDCSHHGLPCGIYMPHNMWMRAPNGPHGFQKFCIVDWESLQCCPVVLGRRGLVDWMAATHERPAKEWPQPGCGARLRYINHLSDTWCRALEVRVQPYPDQPPQKEVLFCEDMPDELLEAITKDLPSFLEAVAEVTASEVVDVIPGTYHRTSVPGCKGVSKVHIPSGGVAANVLTEAMWLEFIQQICLKRETSLWPISTLCLKLKEDMEAEDRAQRVCDACRG